MSQLASSINKRPKETLPSQPVANLTNSSQAHLAQEDQMNQYNLIHIFCSEKQDDDQVSTLLSSTQASTSPSPTPPLLDSDNTKKDKLAENVHKPKASYPNRLKNIQGAQIDKVHEIFNQVKNNVPLLDAIQQVPRYAKFLKDMCTKKRD